MPDTVPAAMPATSDLEVAFAPSLTRSRSGPDGPEATARLREAVADARAALPEDDQGAYDALIAQPRAGPVGGRRP